MPAANQVSRQCQPQMHLARPIGRNQTKDRAGVSGHRYRAGSANSKKNRKQRKKRKSRACMARAPDLRRCRCNLRLRFLRDLRFPSLASMRYPTRHDPCGKDLLQEPDAKRIERCEPAADHAPRQIVHPVTICVFCVHLLTSALKAFFRNAAAGRLRKC